MTLNNGLAIGLGFALLAACGETAPAEPTPRPDTSPAVMASASPNVLVVEEVSTGNYALEKTHASLIWTVSHNGLSKYTSRFTDFDVELSLNAANPASSSVLATINPLSVRTDHPSGEDWDTTLGADEKWFNGAAFPEISYTSKSIELTGRNTGTVTGELSLLGISQIVPLDVTFNNVRNFPWYGERDVIGFSATASLKRSDFGMLALLPDIGDDVSISIEVELVEAEQSG